MIEVSFICKTAEKRFFEIEQEMAIARVPLVDEQTRRIETKLELEGCTYELAKKTEAANYYEDAHTKCMAEQQRVSLELAEKVKELEEELNSRTERVKELGKELNSRTERVKELEKELNSRIGDEPVRPLLQNNSESV